MTPVSFWLALLALVALAALIALFAWAVLTAIGRAIGTPHQDRRYARWRAERQQRQYLGRDV